MAGYRVDYRGCSYCWFPSWARGSIELGGAKRGLDVNTPLEFLGTEPCWLAITRQKGLLPEKARSNLGKLYLVASITNQFLG